LLTPCAASTSSVRCAATVLPSRLKISTTAVR